MADLQMGAGESRFADIIWENEPISSSELARRGQEVLGWKKTTSFTVLKRLCEKGIFQNEKGRVTSLVSRQDFYAARSEKFVEETFSGSLPAFLAAFTTRKRLSKAEINQLRQMVDSFEEE